MNYFGQGGLGEGGYSGAKSAFCCPVLLLSIVILTVFLPHRGITAFAHFYREYRTPKGSHGRKQEKNPITKRT